MPPAELCVVGDADQAIYAFRGATIRNILEFEADYPEARTILLEQNYRSTQTILSAANAVISRNPDRKPKNLWSDAGSGTAIVGYVADNEHDEAAFVAGEVDTLGDDHQVAPGDVAVFYRTNAQSRVFEEVFIRVGLPYKVVGGVRFYERREVRDLLAYLRLLANPTDTVSLRRILNVPKRGIGDRAEAMVEALAERRQDPVRRRAGDRRRGAGHRVPVGQRDQGVRRPHRLAARAGHRRSGAGRGARGDPVPLGLPRRAAGVRGHAGREPHREPAGARRRGPRVRGGQPRRRPSPTSSSGWRWWPTPTRSPTRTARAASSR